jgi:hypothetical protein
VVLRVEHTNTHGQHKAMGAEERRLGYKWIISHVKSKRGGIFVTSSSLHSLFVIFYTKKKFPLFGLGIFQLFCFFIFNVDILCIYIKTKLALFSRNWCCVFPICSIQCSLPNCRPVSVPWGRGGGEHHKILYVITHELQTVRIRQ